MKNLFGYKILLLVMSMLLTPSVWADQQTIVMQKAANQVAATDMTHNPCGMKNPCAKNPCAKNPCAKNPCAKNPCGMMNPCAKHKM